VDFNIFLSLPAEVEISVVHINTLITEQQNSQDLKKLSRDCFFQIDDFLVMSLF